MSAATVDTRRSVFSGTEKLKFFRSLEKSPGKRPHGVFDEGQASYQRVAIARFLAIEKRVRHRLTYQAWQVVGGFPLKSAQGDSLDCRRALRQAVPSPGKWALHATSRTSFSSFLSVNVKQRNLGAQKSIADDDVAMPGKEPGGPTLMPLSSTTPGASNFGRRADRASICFMIRGGCLSYNDR